MKVSRSTTEPSSIKKHFGQRAK